MIALGAALALLPVTLSGAEKTPSVYVKMDGNRESIQLVQVKSIWTLMLP